MPFGSHKAVKDILSLIPFTGASHLHWSDFILPSTLHLSPFLDVLLEPVSSTDNLERVQLGLHEALVNAVRHGNLCDPSKSLRVRRILTPNWLIWQVQDQGKGVPDLARKGVLPIELDSNYDYKKVYYQKASLHKN